MRCFVAETQRKLVVVVDGKSEMMRTLRCLPFDGSRDVCIVTGSAVIVRHGRRVAYLFDSTRSIRSYCVREGVSNFLGEVRVALGLNGDFQIKTRDSSACELRKWVHQETAVGEALHAPHIRLPIDYGVMERVDSAYPAVWMSDGT